MVLICISLMMILISHILVDYLSFLEKCLFTFSAHFLKLECFFVFVFAMKLCELVI